MPIDRDAQPRLLWPTDDEIAAVLEIGGRRADDHVRNESAAPSYTHRIGLIRWLMRRRYEEILALGAPGAGERALEFGSGLGLFLPTLASVCERVFALDVFPDFTAAMIERRGLGNVEIVGGLDAIPDGSLDLVVAADVLEHLEDAGPTAEAFRRKLGPRGRLLVSGPTESFVYRIGRFVAGFHDIADYHHTDVQKLDRRIRAAGFRCTAQRDLPFRPPPHLFRVLRYEPTGA